MEEEIIRSTYVSHRNPNKMKDGLRQCSKCKEYKTLECYGLSRNKDKVNYRGECKTCGALRSKKYQEDNFTKQQISKKNTALKATYGITLDDYNKKLIDQDQCCAICKKHHEETATKRYLSMAVDHDRRCCGPGKACSKCLRGLLCIKCNRALGMFEDNVDILMSAIEYLNGYTIPRGNKNVS